MISDFQFSLLMSQRVQWLFRVFERSTDYCIRPLNFKLKSNRFWMIKKQEVRRWLKLLKILTDLDCECTRAIFTFLEHFFIRFISFVHWWKILFEIKKLLCKQNSTRNTIKILKTNPVNCTLRKRCYWIKSISFQKHVYHGFKSICYRISNIFIGSCNIFLWINSIHAFGKKFFWFNSDFFSVYVKDIEHRARSAMTWTHASGVLKFLFLIQMWI